MITFLMNKINGMEKTGCDSFFSGGLCEGCKRCLRGRKLVLFITGKCSRNCSYCPLSKKRKNVDKIWANERLCKGIKDVFEEVEQSGARGCGITGGDPLLKFERTLKYASALKKRFKEFHIHIYVSTELVTKEKIRQLSRVVDEIRFHPNVFGDWREEKKKISFAQEFFKKKNIGIEIPIFPDKEKTLLEFLKKVSKEVGFLNLNELEMGESNEDVFIKKYKIKEGGYTISNSLEVGKRLLKKLAKINPHLRIHLCASRTKNWYQFRNRLKQYRILPFGKPTEEGTVIYFVTLVKDKKEIVSIEKAFGKNNCFYDKPKKRMVLNSSRVGRNKNKFNIFKVEEYPTFDRGEVEVEKLFK